MSKNERDHLRKQLRSARSSLDDDLAASKSMAICLRAEQLLTNSWHVAAYYAFGREVDLSSLTSALSAQDKQVYVPVVLPEFRMQFALVDENTPITRNQYGIKEPQIDASHLHGARQMDAVLVPLVGFDEHCNRMGMGGGYYDRNFSHRLEAPPPPLLIGVAFDIQCADTVHPQPWDVPLDYVVTETRLLRRS